MEPAVALDQFCCFCILTKPSWNDIVANKTLLFYEI